MAIGEIESTVGLFDWARRLWNWARAKLPLNRQVQQLEARLGELEALVRLAPPRRMVRFREVMVARAERTRDGDPPNQICCTWCHQDGRDSVCKAYPAEPGRISPEPRMRMECLHHAHPWKFIAYLKLEDYEHATRELLVD